MPHSDSCPLYIIYNWTEGLALTGYDIPGCVEDGKAGIGRHI